MEARDYPLPAEVLDLFPDELVESELGLIPKGWKVKPLDEIADYMNGLAMQKYPPVEGQESLPVIKIRELRAGVADASSNRANLNFPSKYIIDDGDIIFSWSGSLIVKVWCGGKGGLNQHLFKVTSADYPKWFYYYCTAHHLDEFQRIAADKATTMGHIKRNHLQEALVL
jgi:type I restriction enzyme S subunit